ncbi:IS256 family transposase [Parageobacillus toebii NBRC 107807]|uniref:Mutator family transposase n=3 Tax=Anoxybacillaceae TaxID=3120669 RepID=A0A6G9J2E9_9BACL|nr:IS256 family transposase [Parageobacillus toebii]MBB3868233.1 transposase-like protein [Parageobacillus toebii NBRC 107807]QIQ32816.1 IS256 family transposase [Parageobacillus toebii NBRC 107807]QSB48499.1 IS256 family transposase [Parageobacillus toebii]
MSKRSIPNVDWANQLESVIRQFVKEKLELIMREEIKHFLEIEQARTPNRRNGCYQRNLDTQYGRIEGLLVPRDRNGEFQTQLFAPYQHHTGWLEEAFRAVYPKADVQRCVVHKVRNTLNRVRKKDQFEVAENLKLIYRAPNKEMALQMFQQFESKWSSKYPREVQSWANELDVLLTFMDDPSSIRSVIYTTNAIERTIKEIRKRLKPMNSLSSLEAAEKVVYLTIQDFNEKWAGRKLRGFAEAQEALERMFEECYN